MKKAVSILVLTTFLFNTIGYKAIFLYLEHKADARLASEIATMNEVDGRLIAIKIPINLPYQTDWKEFESVEGEMTFKDKTYRYVKRKVWKDTLILLCIDHSEKSQIQKRDADYFKKVNEITAETNKKPVAKQTKTDYYYEVTDPLVLSPTVALSADTFTFTACITCGYPPKVKMPPKNHTES